MGSRWAWHGARSWRAMLGAFVEGLGTGDVRTTRARFEQVVRDHLGVPFVRFHECGPAPSSRLDPALAVTKVSSGGRTSARDPRPTRAAQDRPGTPSCRLRARSARSSPRSSGPLANCVAVAMLADRDGNRLHGLSLQVQAVRQQIDRIARTDFTVLIEGESGVGKEPVARQIHQWSRRTAGLSSP